MVANSRVKIGGEIEEKQKESHVEKEKNRRLFQNLSHGFWLLSTIIADSYNLSPKNAPSANEDLRPIHVVKNEHCGYQAAVLVLFNNITCRNLSVVTAKECGGTIFIFLSALKAGWKFFLDELEEKGLPIHMLRNLLWATSKHDAYLIENYSVMHWSSLLQSGKEVFQCGPIVPAMKSVFGSFTQSLSRVQISTMAIKDNLMVVVVSTGNLFCKIRIATGGLLYKITDGENAITNAVDCTKPLMRVFDIENFACLWSVHLPREHFAIPDGKSLGVLGDNVNCLAYSRCSVTEKMGAIRAIKFNSDGRFMAMSEPTDFVHIYDTQSEYSREQKIDLFGEIARISFSLDTEDLFVVVADRTYGSLLEYNRKRSNQYLYVLLTVYLENFEYRIVVLKGSSINTCAIVN
ncbi:hypothetical protein IFM89_030607 [Coptis chinensis]|uniref:Uncharacterized protein n=1 Tax=Coptis chinensis TaxID=261450 RepID=A0A835HQG7_9MAGN|nr:hypothetical protein IFM89_030607 [Coptis chinensis]